ncbi:hypothetical protein PIB30_073275 [Stylosanthes scabra]|uniref:Uncharacterized protein n=1 Tax=Stylosanthes scabra TaxID=79078 RepID=A0ABU6XR55_9FABA|nr:hypothetical protein [Stylosanthes scabra]
MDRRKWSDEETEAFVGFMEECVVEGSAAVSGFDAEEQVGEEAEEENIEMDEVFVSSTPTADVPSQSQGNAAQGTATSAEPSGTQHVQILANAISGKNADVKMGEKLEQLGFADHDAIQIVVKINATPELEKSFWGFTDAQLTTLAQDILDRNFNY